MRSSRGEAGELQSADRIDRPAEAARGQRHEPSICEFRTPHRVGPGPAFMSMSVFPAADYDPLFILEANFDGPPGPFWGQLEPVLGDDLRAIVRCCKRPLDGDAAL